MARTGGIETVNIEAPAPGGASPRLMRGRDRAATVRRLRRDGWSYRRISDVVGLPYNEVSRLLDNDVTLVTDPVRLLPTLAYPPPSPPVSLPPATPSLAPEPLPPATNGAAANTRALLNKVDGLARVADDHRKALEQLTKDVAEVRAEQRALSRRLQDLFTALWQRLTEFGRRPTPSDEASP